MTRSVAVKENDFVIRFANVNGSGSASANSMFAKALFRMGVPVATRNIFPSNIQGLPTWYEVRVSADGWLGRRGGIDFMVAMNAQTWDQALADTDPTASASYVGVPPARKEIIWRCTTRSGYLLRGDVACR
mgnify:CR=1 FL=1